MQYSPQFITTFQKWVRSGSTSMSDSDLAVIQKEDSETATFIRQATRLQIRETSPASALPARTASFTEQWETFGRTHKKHPVRFGLLHTIATNLMDAMKRGNGRQDAIERRVVALEANGVNGNRAAGAYVQKTQSLTGIEERIKALEDAEAEKAHLGPWNPATTYRRHNSVSWDGSTWTCRVPTTRRQPGDNNNDWWLSCMRGRAGKQGQCLCKK